MNICMYERIYVQCMYICMYEYIADEVQIQTHNSYKSTLKDNKVGNTGSFIDMLYACVYRE